MPYRWSWTLNMALLALAITTRASGGMADALASGASVRKDVGIEVPRKLVFRSNFLNKNYFCALLILGNQNVENR
jgi:hypothetical protein